MKEAQHLFFASTRKDYHKDEVIREKFTITSEDFDSNIDKFYTKDGKYWAKTKKEIDLYESFKEVCAITYIEGLYSPKGPIDPKSKVKVVDAYEFYIMGIKNER